MNTVCANEYRGKLVGDVEGRTDSLTSPIPASASGKLRKTESRFLDTTIFVLTGTADIITAKFQRCKVSSSASSSRLKADSNFEFCALTFEF